MEDTAGGCICSWDQQMSVDGHLFNAEGMAEENNDGIVMKDLSQDGSQKLARLLEVVKLDEATLLVRDSHSCKMATAPSCIEDVEADVVVNTVVVDHKKKDNVIELAASSIDWRVC